MRISLDANSLSAYLSRQLANFFPDDRVVETDLVVRRALERVERCFERVVLPHYRREGGPFFNHLHSDHYATFLYFCSNVAFAERGDLPLAEKLYCLNKALNGFMCTYDTALPDRFLIIHTVGMLLGKASYGDCFVAIHNVTIGTDRGKSPRMGEGVIIYGGGSIIGECEIGSNVSVAAHALVRNTSIDSDQVVAGISPDLLIKPAKRVLIREFFSLP